MNTNVLAIFGILLGLNGFVLGRSPNIVLFYADDMGIGDVGCYGCKDIRTPNIDALARAGVRLTNYYSAAPICSPSRAALLTGRYPIRAGVPSNVGSIPTVPDGMSTDEVTIAELAKSRGYATALIGKWHLGYAPGLRPNDQGFDDFFGFHAGCIDYYSHMFYWHDPPHHDLYRNRTEVYEEGQYMTDLIASEAIRFIEQHHGEPFLLYVPFNAPHYPTQAPERFRKMYAKLSEQRRLYAPLVAGLDDAIGKIMDRLAQHDLIQDTFIFFASDNGATTEMRGNGGGGSNSPYRGFKFSLFDGGIHMPAVVSWPGKTPRNETRDQLVIAMDVFATVAEIIGAKLPTDRTMDGRSWMPMLSDAAVPGHDMLFWQQGDQQAVRQGKWKWVRNGVDSMPLLSSRSAGINSRGPALLESSGTRQDRTDKSSDRDAIWVSDIEIDPGEAMNLATKHPDIVEKLSRAHAAWRQSLRPSRSDSKPE